MSRPRTEQSTEPGTNRAARLSACCVTAVGLGLLLAACSDDYWVRRDTIALGAGDAIAGNQISQMVDPWPPHSGDKNIAFNGEKMQAAVQRYRTDKVTQPPNPTTSEVENMQQQAAAAATAAASQPPATPPTVQPTQ